MAGRPGRSSREISRSKGRAAWVTLSGRPDPGIRHPGLARPRRFPFFEPGRGFRFFRGLRLFGLPGFYVILAYHLDLHFGTRLDASVLDVRRPGRQAFLGLPGGDPAQPVLLLAFLEDIQEILDLFLPELGRPADLVEVARVEGQRLLPGRRRLYGLAGSGGTGLGLRHGLLGDRPCLRRRGRLFPAFALGLIAAGGLVSSRSGEHRRDLGRPGLLGFRASGELPIFVLDEDHFLGFLFVLVLFVFLGLSPGVELLFFLVLFVLVFGVVDGLVRPGLGDLVVFLLDVGVDDLVARDLFLDGPVLGKEELRPAVIAILFFLVDERPAVGTPLDGH